MRLSEAIRAGAKMKPAGIGSKSCVPTADNVCALGAAACARGLLGDEASIYAALYAEWPILRVRVSPVEPHYGGFRGNLMERIWLLNDVKLWSREAIADYVEQAEQEYEECQRGANGNDRT